MAHPGKVGGALAEASRAEVGDATAGDGDLGATRATNSTELAGGGPRERKKRAVSRQLVSSNPGAQVTEERAAILLDRSGRREGHAGVEAVATAARFIEGKRGAARGRGMNGG